MANHHIEKIRGQKEAFGRPGIEPRWTHGSKDGVGTAYATSTRIWFTLWNGVITEVYYPTIDRPQIRDLQYLITDGESFFHEEKRHLQSKTRRISPHALGYRVTNNAPEGGYTIRKEIITDPHLPCILQRTELIGDTQLLSRLRLYALCAPHIEVGGYGNNAYVMEVAGRQILTAEKAGTWLALAATIPFARSSCGYVGRSDGWTDLADNFLMDWEFDQALDGNVALTGEIELNDCQEFTLGLALGDSLHNALTTLFQALAIPFKDHKKRYREQWARPVQKILPLQQVSGDEGHLYHGSLSLLLAHEDKTYPGAMIASLSIPWGEAKGDEDMGGYHLVWTRDMVNSAMGLLAAGHVETAFRALIYLATSQQGDGGFPQSFWIDGRPYWRGIQLDEVAFPILLAWRLSRENALQDFDPYPMVIRAASYLIDHGPVTQQERWEEASGYSPSTLASNIAALICSACFARERGDETTAQFLEDYADFLECHIEAWTVTTEGTLVPDINRHFIRIHPVNINNLCPSEDPNRGLLTISNRPPGSQTEFRAKEIVDAGFLELVRYGIRKPKDPTIIASLRVVDDLLKVETPLGPCWRRYNHDGYGQRVDGRAFEGWGKGRAWPLLTGERGHYELAAGRKVKPFIRAMEGFASLTGLLPEQVWDGPDFPDAHMVLGRPTGSAMPLAWAHAEYIKLLRSAFDGQIFDLIPEVANRYMGSRKGCKLLEIWKPNRQVCSVKQGYTLRIQARAPFRLRWSRDDWRTVEDASSRPTKLRMHFVDIPVSVSQQSAIRFTFFWTTSDRWEGRDYEVSIETQYQQAVKRVFQHSVNRRPQQAT
ncbi:MAG TPA: glycoside hydrolase family 15 protein [Candidatus Binatia bacterium]|nr:glycoside hydrolase family 15 protein [Candidatus Binatia bacterium]